VLGAMQRLMAMGGVLALCGALTAAQAPESFAPEQISKGAAIFAQHCADCHGARMADPQAAFDLRRFPRDQKNRFVTAVTRGKDNMPPWGDLLQPEDIEALWAYVMAGEPR
jgi:mono/diheme cytochrome c family protein